MGDRGKTLSVIACVVALALAPRIACAPTDPEARCNEVLEHRALLVSSSTQRATTSDTTSAATVAAEVAQCRDSITERQATCAKNARVLDEFERCFM